MSSSAQSERAVSNAVGIAVLFAVTIFVAGVAGVVVIGYDIEDVTTDNPQASFEYDFEFDPHGPDSLTITHQDGDGLPGEQVRVEIEDTSDPDADGIYRWFELGGPEEITPGASIIINSATLDTDEEIDLDEAEVRLVVEAEDGSQTYRVGTWTGPNR